MDLKIKKENKKMKKILFENFIDYCEDSEYSEYGKEGMRKKIMIFLADYFDIPNRHIPLDKDEIAWIEQNLSKISKKFISGG